MEYPWIPDILQNLVVFLMGEKIGRMAARQEDKDVMMMTDVFKVKNIYDLDPSENCQSQLVLET